MNFLWRKYPHYILKVFCVEGRQVFEVEFSHTPAFRAIVRRVERTQLWYPPCSCVLLECIADLQTGFSLKKSPLGVYRQFYGNVITIENILLSLCCLHVFIQTVSRMET